MNEILQGIRMLKYVDRVLPVRLSDLLQIHGVGTLFRSTNPIDTKQRTVMASEELPDRGCIQLHLGSHTCSRDSGVFPCTSK